MRSGVYIFFLYSLVNAMLLCSLVPKYMWYGNILQHKQAIQKVTAIICWPVVSRSQPENNHSKNKSLAGQAGQQTTIQKPIKLRLYWLILLFK